MAKVSLHTEIWIGMEELTSAAPRHAGELHHVAVETNFVKAQ